AGMGDFFDRARARYARVGAWKTLERRSVAARIGPHPTIEAGGIGDRGGLVLVIGPAHPAERAAHDEAARSITARLGPVRPVRIAVSRIGYLGNDLVGR